MDKLLPPYATIPDEYKRGHTKWNKVVSRWFLSGLPKETRFVAKLGIDENAAKAHLRAILVSFEPKHEHKEAGCAYLLSKWFDDVVVPNAPAETGYRGHEAGGAPLALQQERRRLALSARQPAPCAALNDQKLGEGRAD